MYKIASSAQKYISTLGSGGKSEKQSEVPTGENESDVTRALFSSMLRILGQSSFNFGTK